MTDYPASFQSPTWVHLKYEISGPTIITSYSVIQLSSNSCTNEHMQSRGEEKE